MTYLYNRQHIRCAQLKMLRSRYLSYRDLFATMRERGNLMQACFLIVLVFFIGCIESPEEVGRGGGSGSTY